MQIGGVHARNVNLAGPQVYHLPRWRRYGDKKRIAALRKIALSEGQDPRIRYLASQIIQGSPTAWTKATPPAAAAPRDYGRQAELLLRWVQHHVYYVNEPGEQLQSPEYTLRAGMGDCDCVSILLAALLQSVALPWRFVLSGYRPDGVAVRWIEGTPQPKGVKWKHIYVMVGWPPGRPSTWRLAEPSAKKPLGWDVVQAQQNGEPGFMPEMKASRPAAPVAATTAGWGSWGQETALVPTEQIEEEISASLDPRTWQFARWREDASDTVAMITEQLHWKQLVVTVVVGAVTSVVTDRFMRVAEAWWRSRKS